MPSTNRRKQPESLIAVASTSTSGATAESDNAANSDRVTYYVVLTVTGGSVTFKIQSSPNDGGTWHDMAVSEMSGDTGSIAASGNYHISSSAPFGTRTRLAYTIVTGPVTFLVYPVFEKTGKVY